MAALFRIGFNILALSVTIFLVVDLFYTVAEERLRTGYRAEAETLIDMEAESTRSITNPDYDVIVERNVFGVLARDEKEIEEKEPEQLDPTKLNVALLGTVSGESNNSLAVIWDGANRSEDFYTVGDSIQGAMVRKIRRGEVILRVGERDEILKMRDVTSKDVDERLYARVVSPPASEGSPKAVETETDMVVSRADAGEGLANINQLFTQARIRPHFVDGRPEGLVITHLRPDSVFSLMGLRNGDVITGLDGGRVASPRDALGLFRNLRSGSPFSLEITRRGATNRINYTFD